MARKSAQLKLADPVSTRTIAISEAREHIARASALLRPLGVEFGRIAWMLEDTINYLDESELSIDEEPIGNDPLAQLLRKVPNFSIG